MARCFFFHAVGLSFAGRFFDSQNLKVFPADDNNDMHCAYKMYFSCTQIRSCTQVSDSDLKMKRLTLLFRAWCFCVRWDPPGWSNFGILLLQRRSVGLSVESSVISVLNFDFYFCWFDKLMSKKTQTIYFIYFIFICNWNLKQNKSSRFRIIQGNLSSVLLQLSSYILFIDKQSRDL